MSDTFPWHMTPSNPYGVGSGITRLAHVCGEVVEALRESIESLDDVNRIARSRIIHPKRFAAALEDHAEKRREVRILTQQMKLTGDQLRRRWW